MTLRKWQGVVTIGNFLILGMAACAGAPKPIDTTDFPYFSPYSGVHVRDVDDPCNGASPIPTLVPPPLTSRKIAGTVFVGEGAEDPHRSPIADVDILAEGVVHGRRLLYKVKSDKRGRFSIPRLQEGVYSVAVCSTGLSLVLTGVEVRRSAASKELVVTLRVGT
jgi:hypothetical protein